MGSSKKHKDKSREEKKHKHRDKDKKHHKRKHRHGRSRSRSKERDTEKKRRKHTASPPIRDSPEHKNEYSQRNTAPEISDAAPVGDGTFQESLSIEETNKIRIKLGLAPLQLKDDINDETKEITYADRPDVHKPADNIAAKKKNEKIKEKLALIREKRRLNKKLQKVKTLADDDSDLEDSAAWVERSRKIQTEKEKADKQAKILEEMDAEFGISNLLDDQLMQEKSEAYTARDIAGLRVEHDTQHFRDGSKVILTLKDARILDDDAEDVLLNYNMVDVEKANKNVELKKRRPGYQAYDDMEEDEFGMMKPKPLLSKYDEEIDGETKKSFLLASDGSVDTRADRMSNSIKDQLKAQAVSLESRGLTVAAEYYTPQEMCSFKKPRKKKRRLKTKNVVDELVAMQSERQKKQDHGSRYRRRGDKLTEVEEGEISDEDPKAPEGELDENATNHQVQDMDIEMPNADEKAAPVQVPHNIEDDWEPPLEDEAEKELQKMLNKARRLKQMKQQKVRRIEEQVVAMMTNVKQEDGLHGNTESENKTCSIVLHSTSEFCRALGDIPTYGAAGNRDDDDEEDNIEADNEEVEMKDENEEEVKGWNQVNPDEEDEKNEEDIGPVLEEEPDIRPGCVGALTLAVKKGYLDTELSKKFTTSNKNKYMEAQNFIVEDKNYNDIDSKYNKHDRYRGPLMDFKDKEGYKPEFKLNYVDEAGRALNQKEAFRHLSHRFHGKGSGKLKTEKRLKKVLEEEAMKKMSSTDTPLHTVARMQEKQKIMQTPYIVLSGGGKNLTTNPITK